jgi:hypothetical protein
MTINTSRLNASTIKKNRRMGVSGQQRKESPVFCDLSGLIRLAHGTERQETPSVVEMRGLCFEMFCMFCMFDMFAQCTLFVCSVCLVFSG